MESIGESPFRQEMKHSQEDQRMDSSGRVRRIGVDTVDGCENSADSTEATREGSKDRLVGVRDAGKAEADTTLASTSYRYLHVNRSFTALSLVMVTCVNHRLRQGTSKRATSSSSTVDSISTGCLDFERLPRFRPVDSISND